MNVIRDLKGADSESGVRMFCLSCGSTFADPIILDDELGSMIQVCPVCKSADVAILDDFGFMPNKEDPHD
jgi:hypothetical protein